MNTSYICGDVPVSEAYINSFASFKQRDEYFIFAARYLSSGTNSCNLCNDMLICVFNCIHLKIWKTILFDSSRTSKFDMVCVMGLGAG